MEERVSFEDAIFRHLLNIGDLSTRTFETTTGAWQKNALNFYQSVMTLEKMVSTYLSPKYWKKRNKIIKDNQENYKRARENGTSEYFVYPSRYQYVVMTTKVANDILSEILIELRARGLLIPESFEVSAKSFEG